MNQYYSSSYAEARHRFRRAAEFVGADVFSYPIDVETGLDLTIDVAVLGSDDAPSLVLSSGVHGVEGYFGSAIQLALLDRLAGRPATPGIRYVLIHGVNPFGFLLHRRVNEDNVDLNRNFLDDASCYSGMPPGYQQLDRLLNPPSASSRFDVFRGRLLWQACRMGLQSFKQTVAGGQYELPRGLFYGGSEPSRSFCVIRDECDSWLARSRNILHIDLHSGLGRRGRYKLLLGGAVQSDVLLKFIQSFPDKDVESLGQANGTAYAVSGLFCEWMQCHFRRRDYQFVGVEFGTYNPIRVLAALRAENRAHFYSSERSRNFARAKREILECFCPKSPRWRTSVVENGLQIIEKARQVLTTVQPHQHFREVRKIV